MQKEVNQKQIQLQVGDLTMFKGDAIVNAANPYLAGGGGVDGAIHRVGGPGILRACQKIINEIGRLPAGKAVITHGGQLPAKNVIHTVGPIYKKDGARAPRLLKSAYYESLDLADKMNLKSIAFPSLATGAYGYPVQAAAPIAMTTIIAYLSGQTVIERVAMILFTNDDYLVYSQALQAALELNQASK